MIERPQDYGPQVLMRLQNGLAIPAVSYLEAMRWRGPALAAHLAAVAGVDAVIAPVAPVAAPTIAESDVGNSPDAEAVIQRLTRFTRPVNYLGLPSLAIPSGFTRDGLPVGMQLIGRPFDEATLLRIGAAFQRATDFHDAACRILACVIRSLLQRSDELSDQPPRPGSAQRSIWDAADHLLGLMRVERAGAGRPAFGQDLHGEQLGVDFRLEGPGRADRAGGAGRPFSLPCPAQRPHTRCRVVSWLHNASSG